MRTFTLQTDHATNTSLPSFSLDVDSSKTTAIYSDMDLQIALAELIKEKTQAVLFNYSEGIYERLTIKDNLKFYHRWFGCTLALSEILVMFQLQNHSDQKFKNCNASIQRRVYFAKYYMASASLNVFQEPIQGVDVLTINTFISMLKWMMEEQRPTLVLVSTMEHALLLGDAAYRLQDTSLLEIETETEQDSNETTEQMEKPTNLTVEKLFKIPAKVEDKEIGRAHV